MIQMVLPLHDGALIAVSALRANSSRNRSKVRSSEPKCGQPSYFQSKGEAYMKKTTWIWTARILSIAVICSASTGSIGAAPSRPATQSGIVVPDRFRHAEPFIRTLEAGGLMVYAIAQSYLEASFGGGQKAAYITTDKGVVEVVVLPGATDAEQLTVMYSKWNGNRHHYYITGPSVSKADDVYGQSLYITLHKNWFIETFDAELDGIIKRILGQSRQESR
jgi:hypothetical protein